jgi:hypothetical protein
VYELDRDRLDRLPTRGERWVGIVLSALLAVVFLPASIVFYVQLLDTTDDRRGLTIFATVLAFIGITGAALFYRIAFTRPRVMSVRARQICTALSIVAAAFISVSKIGPPTLTSFAVLGFLLLIIALGALAARKNQDEAGTRGAKSARRGH